jgi:hypothetical protein
MRSFSVIALAHRDKVISATPCNKATNACDFPSLIDRIADLHKIMRPVRGAPLQLASGRMAGNGRSCRPQRPQQSRGPRGAEVILIGRLAQAAGFVGAFRGALCANTVDGRI